MCGITGYYNTNGEKIRDKTVILNMMKVQNHRGPDDSGIEGFSLLKGTSASFLRDTLNVTENGFEGVIGFNRLSIQDLTQTGHQPMVSSDGKVILALNGEIYNALDFREEVKSQGFRLKGTSDTEILLYLYIIYGINGTLERLNGMFSFVIADLREKKLIIARDRFGIKPLYYYNENKVLAFSSELKSFAFLPGFSFELDRGKIDEFLLFRTNVYNTLFRSIKTLEPGCYMVYSEGRGLQIERYFDINSYSRNGASGKFNDSLQTIENVLGSAVKRQLISDVKVGCQLSGGIDSSLVTWFANRNNGQGNFEGVSVIFNEKGYSEEKYINHVTSEVGVISNKIVLDKEYFLKNLSRAAWHLELPLNHPNTIGVFLLSEFARKHVTVLLSGEGADEVFGGYSRFYNIAYPYLNRQLASKIKSGKTGDLSSWLISDRKYRPVISSAFIDCGTASKLYPGFNFERAVSDRFGIYNATEGSITDRQVKYELKTYLPDLLIRQDKMSMAHSIENRVPFLDNETVMSSFCLPENMLIRHGFFSERRGTKYILKKLAEKQFGEEFAFRKKMGFGIPLAWLSDQKEPGGTVNNEIVSSLLSRNIFDSSFIKSHIIEKKEHGTGDLETFWILKSFEVWAQIFLDKQGEF